MSSPSRPTIQIHILREEGVFLARCPQLDIMTQGDTVEDLVAAATDMLQSHFIVAGQLGLFAREAAKIGVEPSATSFNVDVEYILSDPGVHVDLGKAA